MRNAKNVAQVKLTQDDNESGSENLVMKDSGHYEFDIDNDSGGSNNLEQVVE